MSYQLVSPGEAHLLRKLAAEVFLFLLESFHELDRCHTDNNDDDDDNNSIEVERLGKRMERERGRGVVSSNTIPGTVRTISEDRRLFGAHDSRHYLERLQTAIFNVFDFQLSTMFSSRKTWQETRQSKGVGPNVPN